MAKYTYQTATGPFEVEIDERWAALLQAEDIDEQNAGRKHTRPDHKYAPGEPVSLDSVRYDGEWLADHNDAIEEAVLSADLERALQSLTELQWRYFILNRIQGFTYAEIARIEGKRKETVFGTISAAAKKLKNYF